MAELEKGTQMVPMEELISCNENKDMEALAAYGGVEGLAKKLGTDSHHGLADDEAVLHNQEAYGANRHKEQPPKNFFVLCWETAHDPIILLLIAAATVSTVLGSAIPDERAHNGWIEGVAIWIAVMVVIGVGAGNDYQKDQQFRKLNAQKDAIKIKVVRHGQQILVNNTDIVVGDVLCLDTGDKVVADGIVIESFGLVLDEASLTGEGDPIHKNRDEDPWVRSGTQVVDGSGKILVVAVGQNSEWGKILAMVTEEGDDETPLQVKLEWVATAVGKVGFGVAICCFIALLVKWCVENNGFPIKKINDNGPVQFFLYAITIIVVAVPEGLPLAVTISLAYSMKKMMKDNNFVRVLAACETMGGATAICSDKTGTLTENRMTVVTGWFCGTRDKELPAPEALPTAVLEALKVNICMTSKAFITEDESNKMVFVGNRTECALLLMLHKWNIDYNALREELSSKLFRLFGFSSERKMSCCVMSDPGKYTVYNKGAAEWVLQRCTRQYTASGQVIPLTESQKADLLDNHVTAMAKVGLRCIALTTCDMALQDPNRPADFFEEADNVDKDVVLLAIVGIKDPVRPEVPDAVTTCQGAGIVVRMVTGDNIHTAKHIARECGILPEGSNYTAIEGPEFRKMSEEELMKMLPNMRVLARSSPEDKKTLVKTLRAMGDVVAVTGDGTNDAAALKASDVGLAMGIAGTEVAKEAADIVILDDNFSSIVKSVLWGRSVFTNIRKFLQFQLTVNFVALVTAFVAAIVDGSKPLNVLQLLWVNMIMDSMGALALATENPTPELLLLQPHGRDEPLISGRMWTHILTQGLYQLAWMFIFLYAMPDAIPRYYKNRGPEYYASNCLNDVLDNEDFRKDHGLFRSSVPEFCTIMQNCGYPYTQDKALCPLTYTGNIIRDLCGADAECPRSRAFVSAEQIVGDAYTEHDEENHTRALSLLFNAFIFMQLANEINARRINDEYDFFSGIHKSNVFIGVIVVTGGLQAIIINFLGPFFKTVPLDWKEWLASIAIGTGSWITSWLVRWLSRTFNIHRKHDAKTGVAIMLRVSGERRAAAKLAKKAAAQQNGTQGSSQLPEVKTVLDP